MKMCPALTVKNCHQYQPFTAVGCVSGSVQICDVSNGLVKKELAIHNYAVKGKNFSVRFWNDLSMTYFRRD